MKRTIALLLSALLALSASSALGSEVMTLDEKLALQLQNGSGLIVAADFSASATLEAAAMAARSAAVCNSRCCTVR